MLSKYKSEYGSEKFPPLEDFQHVDPGHQAVGRPIDGLSQLDITPNIGTELVGRQLSSFTDAEKNELALLAAQRGVLVFKDQDFAEIGAVEQKRFVEYFGRLHIHPTSAHIHGHPEFHLVSSGSGDTRDKYTSELPVVNASGIPVDLGVDDSISTMTWHSDVSYERQPVGTTFLWILENPETGGDTVFASQVEAYNRLSREFRKRLEGLYVTHSAHEQANASLGRGGVVRRDPIVSVHPLVRTHPVTGQKALYVNRQFSRKIVGYKQEESDLLLNFLYDHVAKGVDFQARVRWTPGTVVVWDNRVTVHSAIRDLPKGAKRVIARLAAQAEKPELV